MLSGEINLQLCHQKCICIKELTSVWGDTMYTLVQMLSIYATQLAGWLKCKEQLREEPVPSIDWVVTKYSEGSSS